MSLWRGDDGNARIEGMLNATATAVVHGPEDVVLDLAVGRLAAGRSGRNAAAEADLRGVAKRGPEQDPRLAEADLRLSRCRVTQQRAQKLFLVLPSRPPLPEGK